MPKTTSFLEALGRVYLVLQTSVLSSSLSSGEHPFSYTNSRRHLLTTYFVFPTFPSQQTSVPTPAATPPERKMSNESWEEVLPYSLSTHAVLESTSDDGSGQKPEPQQSEPTLIYGTNFDEDVDGTGPLMQARGALVWLVIIAVWIFAVSLCATVNFVGWLALVLSGFPFRFCITHLTQALTSSP